MGALTKQERDALDDVFSSIHSRGCGYERISLVVAKLLKQAKIRLKIAKTSHFSPFFNKKKKYLSK